MLKNTEQPADVFVGIVTHNRADILRKSLASALAQRDVKLRVAVIDDGSTDATPDIAQEFPSVEWQRHVQSQGHVAARNHWMTSATEEYFVSLDDDAWFMQGDEVSIAVQALRDNSALGAIAFDILSPDRPTARARADMQRVPAFIGCGHVLRLSAVRRIGYYEPTPGAYGTEEKDLCLRMLDAGYDVALLPGVDVWHDKTPVARHLPAQYQSGVANDLMLTYRRTPLLLLPFAALAKLFQHLRGANQSGQMRACWGGFGSFFRALPAMWQTRRPVRLATLRTFIRLGRA